MTSDTPLAEDSIKIGCFDCIWCMVMSRYAFLFRDLCLEFIHLVLIQTVPVELGIRFSNDCLSY